MGEAAIVAYHNTFDDPSSIADFTVVEPAFSIGELPALVDIGVENGELNMETDVFYPNGFGGGSSGINIYDNVSITVVPEPGVIALVFLSGGLALVRRRRA